MELLSANLINTTTQLVVQSNSALASNIFNPDRILQYVSDGYNNDATTTTIRINFDETTAVDRIAILNHNLKGFQFYYNGATANAISLTGAGVGYTGTANFSTNSSTSHYLTFASPINCTSLSIDLKTTIVANAEKAIGQLVLSAQELDFTRIPNAAGYQPTLDPKQIVHQLSDGGTRLHVVRDKWRAKIKLSQIDTTFRNQLKNIYDQHTAFVFVPFPTATAWDEVMFECLWIGPFNFYRFSDNAANVGFSGDIDLRETAS